MRHRIENTDREIAHALDQIARKNGTLTGAARAKWMEWNKASMLTIGGMQFYTVDVPTWVAAYNKEMSSSGNTDTAVKYADSVVRTSQATGHTKDLSALQRQKGLWRALTMFASYTMVLYNLEAQTASDVKRVKDLPNAVARMSWLVVLPSIADALMRQEWPEDDDPATFAKHFSLKAIGYGASAVPVAGRAVDSMLQGFRPELSAVESLGKHGQKSFNQIGGMLSGKKQMDVGMVKSFTQFVGTAAGLGGTAQLARGLDALEATVKGSKTKPYDFLTGYKEPK